MENVGRAFELCFGLLLIVVGIACVVVGCYIVYHLVHP